MTIYKKILLLVSIFVFSGGILMMFNSALWTEGTLKDEQFTLLIQKLLATSLLQENLPLADSEQIIEKTHEILGFDRYIYKLFSLPSGESLYVFIAFWNPGNASQRAIAYHNPDVCWVSSAGWREIDRIERAVLHLENGNCKIFPVEYRLLEYPDGKRRYHTYFWQMSGHRTVAIDRKGSRLAFDYLRTIGNRIRAKRDSMWFIRIHSEFELAAVSALVANEPIAGEEQPSKDRFLVNNPMFEQLLQSLTGISDSCR